jgi:hypothetical protein
LVHIDEAGRRPQARERELELARSRLLDAWGVAEALLERNPRSADLAALRCPVIAQQIAAVYGFLGEPENMRRWLVKGYLASRAQLGNQVDGLHDLIVEKVKSAKSPRRDVHSVLKVDLCSRKPDSGDLLWVSAPGEVWRPGRYERKLWEKVRLMARDPAFEGEVAGLVTMDAESQLLRLACIAAGADEPVLRPGAASPKVASVSSAGAGERRALRYEDSALVVFSPMTAASISARGPETSVLRKGIDDRYSDILPLGALIWP